MALITRRYVYRGPWPLDLRTTLDPGITLTAPSYQPFFDLTFDDAVVAQGAVDERMRRYGCFPDTSGSPLSIAPPLALVAPDGSVWRLTVTNLGILVPVLVV